jgi:hypothetical protein
MSSLLNIELDNFGDSISSISGLVEDFDSITNTAIIGKVIKKDDFVIMYRAGKIILIKRDSINNIYTSYYTIIIFFFCPVICTV